MIPFRCKICKHNKSKHTTGNCRDCINDWNNPLYEYDYSRILYLKHKYMPDNLKYLEECYEKFLQKL